MYHWYLRGHSVPTIVLELLDTPADVTRLLTLQLSRKLGLILNTFLLDALPYPATATSLQA